MESTLPQVFLKTTHRSKHPWIFQRMVERPQAKIENGEIVDIHDSNGEWMGRGIFNNHSMITLRVLTEDPKEEINQEFISRKISAAIDLRHQIFKLPNTTDAYRLIHSEGDNLSGLVVDRYGDTLVIEYFSAGMHRMREMIEAELKTHFPNATFYAFAERHVQSQEVFSCKAPQAPKPFQITENGLKFYVQPGGKHKTGFFVDQRDNRALLASFCEGKRVADICCNSGGFAVYAKTLGKAHEVVGIDLDEEILPLAERNSKLNKAKIRYVHVDLFPWLRDAILREEKYDVVVLDPAKQTRDRDMVDDAIQRYVDMNRLAMQIVAPGGILLTCSCTGLVPEEQFLLAIQRAARYGNKTAQIFKISGAGVDHPFLSNVYESRYLKAVWCRVF